MCGKTRYCVKNRHELNSYQVRHISPSRSTEAMNCDLFSEKTHWLWNIITTRYHDHPQTCSSNNWYNAIFCEMEWVFLSTSAKHQGFIAFYKTHSNWLWTTLSEIFSYIQHLKAPDMNLFFVKLLSNCFVIWQLICKIAIYMPWVLGAALNGTAYHNC